MKTVATVLLFLCVGLSAEAFTCLKCDSYLADTCKDPIDEICPSNVKQCNVQVVKEKIYGLTLYQSKRGCAVDKNVCNANPNIKAGEYVEIERPSYCCGTDYCNAGPIKIENPKGIQNGLQCPSCFVMAGTCVEKFIDCVDQQTYCYHFDGTIFSGAKFEQWIIMGCANKAACEYKPNPERDLPFYGKGYKLKCWKPDQPHQPHQPDQPGKPIISIHI